MYYTSFRPFTYLLNAHSGTLRKQALQLTLSVHRCVSSYQTFNRQFFRCRGSNPGNS